MGTAGMSFKEQGPLNDSGSITAVENKEKNSKSNLRENISINNINYKKTRKRGYNRKVKKKVGKKK